MLLFRSLFSKYHLLNKKWRKLINSSFRHFIYQELNLFFFKTIQTFKSS